MTKEDGACLGVNERALPRNLKRGGGAPVCQFGGERALWGWGSERRTRDDMVAANARSRSPSLAIKASGEQR